MASVVYILSALTSLMCAMLLLRGYARTRVRLLLWTGIFFAALVVNNSLLFIDLVLLPQVDLGLYRNLPTLAGLIVLIGGLIFDSE